MFISACVCLIVLPIPAFMLIAQGNTITTLLGLALLGVGHVQLIGPLAATLPALFPTKVRYAAFCIGYNISTSLFGGTAPLVNESVVQSTGNSFFPAYYVMGAALISLIPVLLMKETARRPLSDEMPPTSSPSTA